MSGRHRKDAIVRTLRRNGSATIAELVQEVGASRRTILRDISALRDEGFVIHSEPGRGGGLQLDPQSVQTTAKLTVTELFALLISVASMRAAWRMPFSDLADAGLSKIEKALPADKIRDLRKFLDRLFVGELAPQVDLSDMGEMHSTLLPAFEHAFLQRKRLRFQYRDAKRAMTRREVEPQAMLILPPLWYLVAWDPTRSDFRHFRMDRISDASYVDESKFQRKHVAFDDHVQPLRNLSKRPGAKRRT